MKSQREEPTDDAGRQHVLEHFSDLQKDPRADDE
jgi:hypothetical protein